MNSDVVGCAMNVFCAAPTIIGAEGRKVAADSFKRAAEDMYTGYDSILKEFLTSWLNSKFVVSLDNSATEWFHSASAMVTIGLLTIGIIIAGTRVMYEHRGEPLREVLHALGHAIAVISFGTTAIQILVWGGDAFAAWILQVSGTSAGSGQLVADFASNFPALALIFGLLGVLAVGFQWVIMFVRQALLLLLNAFWQMTAAYATFRRGQKAFESVTAWIVAFIFYTPIAASIYAFAWRLKNGDDGPGGVLYGLALIVLAIVALPAIMRLLIPAASVLGGAIGGGMALGVAAAALQAGVAIGAAVATGGASAAAGAGAGTTAAAEGGGMAAEGGEIASAKGETGERGADGSSAAGGGSSDASDSIGGGGDSGAAPDSGGPASGGAPDSGSGQSSGSRAAWAAAGSGVDNLGDEGNTAEGLISE